MVRFISAAVVITSFVLYINSIFCGFVFDDLPAVVKNKDVLGDSPLSSLLWNDYWGMNMSLETSHKSYRPFTVLSFRVNHYIFGAEPWSYHLVNVFLNCFVCYLVLQFYTTVVELCFYKVVSSIKKEKKKKQAIEKNQYTSDDESYIAIVATLLFTVHPVHTEAVTGVVGRAELLSAIFFILSILCYLKFAKKFQILSMVLIVLAVLSKEQGITVIALCVFMDAIIVNKLTLDDFCLLLVSTFYSSKKIKFKPLIFRTFLFVGFGVVLLASRYYLMKGELPHFTEFDNPASALSFPARHLTFNYLLPVNAWLLLNPSELLCDWTMGTIPVIEGFSDVRNLATLIFWIFYVVTGFSVFFSDSVSKLLSLSIAILTFSFIPAANLFFNVGFVIAERILFIPSIGFCLLMATGLWYVKRTFKCDRLITAGVALLLLTHSVKTVYRNTEWKSEEDLFKSGLKITQRNAKIWNNVGHVYEGRGMWKEALEYFNQGVTVQPDDIGSQMNVARMYEKLGDKINAEAHYWKAKALFPKPIKGKKYFARIAPGNLQVFVKLSNILKENNRLEEADKLYKEAIQLRPSFFDAYMNRGEILVRLNRSQEALRSYYQALQLTSTNKSDVYFNIGIIHSSRGNMTGAVEAYTYAIAHNPNNVPALFNSAAIFEETNDRNLLTRARTRCERVLKLEPYNVPAHALLGSIFMGLGDNEKAIYWWKKGLKLNDTNRVCLFNLALIYSKMDGKEQDCVDAVHNLLRHHPNHRKGLLLYADHLLNKIKNVEEAKKIYQRLLELDPKHVEANHNYCVALVEERNLKEAEKCLLNVYKLAPHLDYVQENLGRVQSQIKFLEAREKDKKKSETTSFQKSSIEEEQNLKEPKQGNQKPPNIQEEEEEEDVVYVAQPTKQKQLNPLEEAKKIRDNLSDNQYENDIKENLKRTVKAVEKLKKIKKKVRDKVKQDCEKSEKVSDLKQKALKVLDQFEAKLD